MYSTSNRKSFRKKMAKAALLAFCLPAFAFAKADESHHSHGAAAPSKSNIKESWEALTAIQAGNKRFSEGSSKHKGQEPEDLKKLATGQQPPVIVLSCSDSRVPPEKIFDEGPGKIFTIRLAGHVVNSDAIGSIEYALEHLGSKVLVVMGHDSCGAVKAALTTPEGKSTGSPHIDSLIAKIRPAISGFKSIPAEDKTLEGPVKANVTATVKDLIKRSKIIREFIESDRLLIAQGIYHLASGQVDFWSVGQPIIVMKELEELGVYRAPASHKSSTKAHHNKPNNKRESASENSWKKSSGWKPNGVHSGASEEAHQEPKKETHAEASGSHH